MFFYIFSNISLIIDKKEIYSIEKERTIKKANFLLNEKLVTITSFHAFRSAGGIHDFYSEGDYWWPDSSDSNKPYIRRDGLTNPNNFVKHRQALIHFSISVSTLTSAYILTTNKIYSDKAIEHLKAWFINEKTKMNPNLEYAQAIKGITTGRGIGIIDAIHLVEVAQAILVLEKQNVILKYDLQKIKSWFKEFLLWLTTSPKGIEEREAKNNHGTCWAMQVAEYSKLVNDKMLIEYCIKRFKDVLLKNQMANDGSFPLEIERTKPYSYSLFNLDVMFTICQILNEYENLYEYELPNKIKIKNAIEFMYPFIIDKSKWPYQKDVMYFEYFPNRQPSLLFAAFAYNEKKYFDVWKKLNPDPTNEEVIRNFPIRNPILWLN